MRGDIEFADGNIAGLMLTAKTAKKIGEDFALFVSLRFTRIVHLWMMIDL